MSSIVSKTEALTDELAGFAASAGGVDFSLRQDGCRWALDWQRAQDPPWRPLMVFEPVAGTVTLCRGARFPGAPFKFDGEGRIKLDAFVHRDDDEPLRSPDCRYNDLSLYMRIWNRGNDIVGLYWALPRTLPVWHKVMTFRIRERHIRLEHGCVMHGMAYMRTLSSELALCNFRIEGEKAAKAPLAKSGVVPSAWPPGSHVVVDGWEAAVGTVGRYGKSIEWHGYFPAVGDAHIVPLDHWWELAEAPLHWSAIAPLDSTPDERKYSNDQLALMCIVCGERHLRWPREIKEVQTRA